MEGHISDSGSSPEPRPRPSMRDFFSGALSSPAQAHSAKGQPKRHVTFGPSVPFMSPVDRLERASRPVSTATYPVKSILKHSADDSRVPLPNQERERSYSSSPDTVSTPQNSRRSKAARSLSYSESSSPRQCLAWSQDSPICRLQGVGTDIPAPQALSILSAAAASDAAAASRRQSAATLAPQGDHSLLQPPGQFRPSVPFAAPTGCRTIPSPQVITGKVDGGKSIGPGAGLAGLVADHVSATRDILSRQITTREVHLAQMEEFLLRSGVPGQGTTWARMDGASQMPAGGTVLMGISGHRGMGKGSTVTVQSIMSQPHTDGQGQPHERVAWPPASVTQGPVQFVPMPSQRVMPHQQADTAANPAAKLTGPSSTGLFPGTQPTATIPTPPAPLTVNTSTRDGVALAKPGQGPASQGSSLARLQALAARLQAATAEVEAETLLASSGEPSSAPSSSSSLLGPAQGDAVNLAVNGTPCVVHPAAAGPVSSVAGQGVEHGPPALQGGDRGGAGPGDSWQHGEGSGVRSLSDAGAGSLFTSAGALPGRSRSGEQGRASTVPSNTPTDTRAGAVGSTGSSHSADGCHGGSSSADVAISGPPDDGNEGRGDRIPPSRGALRQEAGASNGHVRVRHEMLTEDVAGSTDNRGGVTDRPWATRGDGKGLPETRAAEPLVPDACDPGDEDAELPKANRDYNASESVNRDDDMDTVSANTADAGSSDVAHGEFTRNEWSENKHGDMGGSADRDGGTSAHDASVGKPRWEAYFSSGKRSGRRGGIPSASGQHTVSPGGHGGASASRPAIVSHSRARWTRGPVGLWVGMGLAWGDAGRRIQGTLAARAACTEWHACIRARGGNVANISNFGYTGHLGYNGAIGYAGGVGFAVDVREGDGEATGSMYPGNEDGDDLFIDAADGLSFSIVSAQMDQMKQSLGDLFGRPHGPTPPPPSSSSPPPSSAAHSPVTPFPTATLSSTSTLPLVPVHAPDMEPDGTEPSARAAAGHPGAPMSSSSSSTSSSSGPSSIAVAAAMASLRRGRVARGLGRMPSVYSKSRVQRAAASGRPSHGRVSGSQDGIVAPAGARTQQERNMGRRGDKWHGTCSARIPRQ
eukprot:jgi/Mesvir1/13085/Mv06069-RA.1